MRKFKIDKNLSTRIASLSMAGMIFVTTIGLTGCSKKEENNNESTSIQIMVEDTNNKIATLLPETNEEIMDTVTLMLLLNLLAPKDENEKISADTISKFKSNIDADDMINEFNSFLDIVEQKAILEGELEKISSVLPDELSTDRLILSNLEMIVENIIKYSDDNNKDGVIKEFNKIYKLFVQEKQIELNSITFEIRDLTYSSRAVANMYAETAAYYARNYITEKEYKKIDDRTNDQNSKAYLKSILEILDNQMEEVSEVDVISLFDDKYNQVNQLLRGKVNLSQDSIKSLVNYINLKYLESDKVAIKDMNQIVGEYEDEKINDVMNSIEAINTYNLKNQNNFIPFSVFLVDEYLKTETGKTDKVALDFVQFNTVMFLNKNNINSKEAKIYFENIYKYFTKQDFSHLQNNQEENIIWQEISDGTNFVNYQVIIYTLNKLTKDEIINNYIEVTEENLSQSIQYIQNTIMDECKKVDINEYVKSK